MRIVDEWTHRDTKITVFHMNGRYSLKLEKNLLEQTYKFRDGQFQNISHLKLILNEEFYKTCNKIFQDLDNNRASMLNVEEEDIEFDNII